MEKQQPKKLETRTEVDSLFLRANILSEKPARKISSKSKESQLFETTLIQICKKLPLFGTEMGPSFIHP